MKTRKIFLAIVVILASAASSGAWELNHTYVDPSVDIANPNANFYSGTTATADCPNCGHYCPLAPQVQTTDVPASCCANSDCSSQYNYTQTVTTTTTNEPLVNETCFRPTCYYRAANEALLNPMPVQPLTTDTTAILKAVGAYDTTEGMQASKISATLDFQEQVWAKPNNPAGSNTPDPNAQPINMSNNYATVLSSSPYGFNGNGSVSGWQTDIGTSAMQGLLWSWRMLSPSWFAVWTNQSDYETDSTHATARQSLPDPADSKNIILISDGVDSDGPDNNPLGAGVTTNIITATDNRVSYPAASSGGAAATSPGNNVTSTGFIIPANSTSSAPNTYETCGAYYNVPLVSVKDGDYVRQHPSDPPGVCDVMAQEGIKVNVILYGYDATNASNARLAACATATGGILVSDSDPTKIAQDLQTVFAAIASQQIKLVK